MIGIKVNGNDSMFARGPLGGSFVLVVSFCLRFSFLRFSSACSYPLETRVPLAWQSFPVPNLRFLKG